MTPLILKGCKSVQYFITQQQYQATLPRQGRQGGNTLAWSPQCSAAVRTARSPCASWLIQCEWCNNSQLHEGGKHGVGSNTTRVVPRRCTAARATAAGHSAVAAVLSQAGERRAQKYAWASSIRVVTTLRTFRRTYSHTECQENDMGLH